MKKQNLFSATSGELPDEIFEEIVTCEQVKIERIVSKGHASPDDHWYDQEKNEWVMVAKGRAVLVFEDGKGPLTLGPGDHVNIPAHCRHRVEWTDPDTETIWLAVHY